MTFGDLERLRWLGRLRKPARLGVVLFGIALLAAAGLPLAAPFAGSGPAGQDLPAAADDTQRAHVETQRVATKPGAPAAKSSAGELRKSGGDGLPSPVPMLPAGRTGASGQPAPTPSQAPDARLSLRRYQVWPAAPPG